MPMPLYRLPAIAAALLLGASACNSSDDAAAASRLPVSESVATGDVAPAAQAAHAAHAPAVPADSTTVTVYKSPTCGCCKKWVTHMQEAGFTVVSIDTDDMNAVKQKHGITGNLGSCHTATVGGYVVEGHVPAADVKRLLAERPSIAGLAVPGMPMGSPGMEGVFNEKYDVVAFDRSGGRSVFASH